MTRSAFRSCRVLILLATFFTPPLRANPNLLFMSSLDPAGPMGPQGASLGIGAAPNKENSDPLPILYLSKGLWSYTNLHSSLLFDPDSSFKIYQASLSVNPLFGFQRVPLVSFSGGKSLLESLDSRQESQFFDAKISYTLFRTTLSYTHSFVQLAKEQNTNDKSQEVQRIAVRFGVFGPFIHSSFETSRSKKEDFFQAKLSLTI